MAVRIWALVLTLVLLSSSVPVIAFSPESDQEEPPAELSGVLVGPDGTPFEGIRVSAVRLYACNAQECHLLERENQTRVTAQSNETGHWSLEIPAGGLEVRLADDFQARERHSAAEQRLTLKPGAHSEILFDLTPIPESYVTVRATMTDAERGEPVQSPRLRMMNHEWTDLGARGTKEIADGTVETQVPPGLTTFRANAPAVINGPCPDAVPEGPDGQPFDPGQDGADMPQVAMIRHCDMHVNPHDYATQAKTVHLEPGQTYDIRFDLHRLPSIWDVLDTRAQVAGWLLDEDGDPIADSWVTAYNEATFSWGATRTDEDGSFRFQIHEGPVHLIAAPVGHLRAAVTTPTVHDGITYVAIETQRGAPSRGTCCWGPLPATYPLDPQAPLPAPPQREPAPTDPVYGRTSLRSPHDSPEKYEVLETGTFPEQVDNTADLFDLFEWKEDIEGEPGGLGTYDPTLVAMQGPEERFSIPAGPVLLLLLVLVLNVTWHRTRPSSKT